MSPAPRLPQADIYVSKNVKCMLVIVNVFADGIRHIRAQLLSSRPRRALGSARASQATKQRPSDNRCHGPSTLAKLMLSQKKKEIQYISVNILECSHLPCFAVNWDGRTRQVLCDPRDRRSWPRRSFWQRNRAVFHPKRCELPEARVK